MRDWSCIFLWQVDIFMDAAFGAVHTAIGFLEIQLSEQNTDFLTKLSLSAERIINFLCQQCEASLQFLQSLCQQKIFRERLLRNKVSQLEPFSFLYVQSKVMC